MKKLTRAVLASAVVLSLGVGILPAMTHAEGNGRSSSPLGRENPDHRRGMGVIGEVTAVNDHGDGTGTITLTTLKPPTDRPAWVRHVSQGDEHGRPVPGSSVTIEYNSDTVFMVDGEEATAADLLIGAKVRVMGMHNGDEIIPARLITTDMRVSLGMAHRGLMGIVSAIDTVANVITVERAARGNHAATTSTVQYSDTTKFVDDGEVVSEDDVSVDGKVHVRGKVSIENGTVTVSDVMGIHIK